MLARVGQQTGNPNSQFGQIAQSAGNTYFANKWDLQPMSQDDQTHYEIAMILHDAYAADVRKQVQQGLITPEEGDRRIQKSKIEMMLAASESIAQKHERQRLEAQQMVQTAALIQMSQNSRSPNGYPPPMLAPNNQAHCRSYTIGNQTYTDCY
jgi:hypothetical protein